MPEDKERAGEEPAPQAELIGGVEAVSIVVVPYRQEWPKTFDRHRARIAAALGTSAVGIDHIGSTAVPGLAAKPIVDILLAVADSTDEASYLPALERAGYELRVREPGFEEHRMFRTPGRDVHVHVLSAGSPEIERYLRSAGRAACRALPARAIPGAQARPRRAGLAGHERLCSGKVQDDRGNHPVVEADGPWRSAVGTRRAGLRAAGTEEKRMGTREWLMSARNLADEPLESLGDMSESERGQSRAPRQAVPGLVEPEHRRGGGGHGRRRGLSRHHPAAGGGP